MSFAWQTWLFLKKILRNQQDRPSSRWEYNGLAREERLGKTIFKGLSEADYVVREYFHLCCDLIGRKTLRCLAITYSLNLSVNGGQYINQMTFWDTKTT